MPNIRLRIADEFSQGLSEIYSDNILKRIDRAIRNLMVFPEMGSPLVRPSLANRYGEGLRQIPIGTLLIIYKYDGTTIDVLALVFGPSVI